MGKKIELAVKQIVSGRKIKPSGAVANTESLKLYEQFFELEKLAAQDRLRLSKL
jgi:acetoacetyl-CoA synthetase